MSMLMIRPGPLEGGPTVSPGSAKSREGFSAHLKSACDGARKETCPEPENPSLNKPKPGDAPPSEKPFSTKRDVALKEKPSNPSSRQPQGNGTLSSNGSEMGSEVDSEEEILPIEVPENPEESCSAVLLMIHRAVEPSVDEIVPDQGEVDLPQEKTSGDRSVDLPDVFSGTPNECPPESEPTKEDPAKNKVAPLTSLFPVPLPMGVMVVQPPELPRPTEGETSVAPQKEDPVPVVLGGISGTTPPVEDQRPEMNAGKEIGLPKKNLEAHVSTVPVHMKAISKKRGESTAISVPGEGNNSPSDHSGVQAELDPQINAVRTDLPGSGTKKQEMDVRNDSPPTKEIPAPNATLPSDVMPQVPLTSDAIPKPKDTPGVAPIHAETTVSGEGPFVVTTGMGTHTAPVSDAAPASAERPAPQVVTPSPIDLARQIHVHLASGRSVVRIDLHPNHLGELRISMETKGKDVSMQFTVDNDQARTAVVAGLREITGTLSSLGWSVSGLAVHVSSGGVGDGRGETPGTLWGQGKSNSNTVEPEIKTVAPSPNAGRWRVNLVA